MKNALKFLLLTLCLIILFQHAASAQWSIGPRLGVGPAFYSGAGGRGQVGVNFQTSFAAYYQPSLGFELEMFIGGQNDFVRDRNGAGRYYANFMRSGAAANLCFVNNAAANTTFKMGIGAFHSWLLAGGTKGDFQLLGERYRYNILLEEVMHQHSMCMLFQMGAVKNFDNKISLHLMAVASGHLLPGSDDKELPPGLHLQVVSTLSIQLGKR